MVNEQKATLREGLAQFYAKNESQLSHNNPDLPPSVKSFFRSHDVAHVLFICDISLFGEGSVKIWTIFGTTLGFWSHLSAYKKANAFELARAFGFASAIRDFWKLIFAFPNIVIRARNMKKRWPWEDFEGYLDMPLDQIREMFNIKVDPLG